MCMHCDFFIKETLKNSREAYEAATKTCEEKLKPTHPIRLGLALNFSVFYYEIAGQKDKACELAKKVRSCQLDVVFWCYQFLLMP